jgi:hypothetical protein
MYSVWGGVSSQLFLEERARRGDLVRLWHTAVQTDLTFNLVSTT